MKEKIVIFEPDHKAISFLTEELKKKGHACKSFSTSHEILDFLKLNEAGLCLVLLNVDKLKSNPSHFIHQIQIEFPRSGIVAISEEGNVRLATEALHAGAMDYIDKPFQMEVARSRIQKALERLRLENENREYQSFLEEKVEDRSAVLIQKHRSLRKLYLNTVEAIVRAIEAKDPYTVGHSKRVSKYCFLLARKMNIPHEEINDIEVAGLLHDVGKIGISDTLLRKPSKLTIEEYETIQEHPLISLKIIDPIHELNKVKEFVKYHHEKWDGRGYPDGLKGENIPLGAMILAVADAFDTMWIGRLYHPPWDLETVVKEFQKNSGTQFDPKVVDAFILLIKEDKESLEKIRKENPPRFS